MYKSYSDITHNGCYIYSIGPKDVVAYRYNTFCDGTTTRTLVINGRMFHDCYLEDICMESETIAKGNM